MADIKKILLPGMSEAYDIVDAGARELIEELEAYTDYLGVTTTEITDGATTNPITIGGESITAKKGNIVNYGSKEFIFNGTAWQEFGDLSALGALAYKSSASGSYTPAGTMTDPTVSLSGTGTAAAQAITLGGTLTAAGQTITLSGKDSITASKPNVTVTPTTDTFYEVDSVGTAASCTMPTYEVDANGVLTITAGSFTANTPASLKSTATTFMTGASAELAAAPTIDASSLSASAGDSSVSYANFTATAAESSVSVAGVTATATGTAFAGTAATITVS